MYVGSVLLIFDLRRGTRVHGPRGVPFALGLVFCEDRISRLCARATFGYDVRGKWSTGAECTGESV